MVPGTAPPRKRNAGERDTKRLPLEEPNTDGFIDFLVNMIEVSEIADLLYASS